MLCLQILNAILGSGLLGIPHVMAQLGVFLGMMLLLCVCIVTFSSGVIILAAVPTKTKAEQPSISEILRQHMTPGWSRSVCVGVVVGGVFLQEFGALVSYLYILMNDLTMFHPLAINIFLFTVLWWLVTLDLTKVSGVSVASMLLFLIVKMAYVWFPGVLLCSPTVNATRLDDAAVNSTVASTAEVSTVALSKALLAQRLNPVQGLDALDVFDAVATCFFAMVCNTTVASLGCAHGMRRVTEQFLAAVVIAFIVYVVTAVCDLATFPSIDANILTTFVCCIPAGEFIAGFYKMGLLTTIPMLFLSVVGELPGVDHIVVKGVGLLLALFVANLAGSLQHILVVFGGGVMLVNVFCVPMIVYCVLW